MSNVTDITKQLRRKRYEQAEPVPCEIIIDELVALIGELPAKQLANIINDPSYREELASIIKGNPTEANRIVAATLKGVIYGISYERLREKG